MKTHVLYRFYGDGGTLLYIGISATVASRMGNHKNVSGWFDLAKSITFERFESRKDVLLAEKCAIKKEAPIYNVVHSESEKKPAKRLSFFPSDIEKIWEYNGINTSTHNGYGEAFHKYFNYGVYPQLTNNGYIIRGVLYPIANDIPPPEFFAN